MKLVHETTHINSQNDFAVANGLIMTRWLTISSATLAVRISEKQLVDELDTLYIPTATRKVSR